MKARAFELPDGVEVASLLIERMNETSLKPDSPVIVLNRGRKVMEMTFDGNHIPIPVGYFETEYGAALHFKERAVVPGTRNLEVGGFVSWFAIIGSSDGRVAVDPPEMCQPFTDEELQAFGESIEAIDRKAMSGPDRNVVRVGTQAARAMSRSQGAAMRVAIDTTGQVSDAAAEAAAHVFEPPTEPLASREAEFEAGRRTEEPAAYEPPVYAPPPVDENLPAPRPMRSQQRNR